MCCSRNHYPATVGLHTLGEPNEIFYDHSQLHHYHIILPWDLNQTTCISAASNSLSLTCRDFNNYYRRQLNVSLTNVPYFPEERPLWTWRIADLLAIAIVEGGEIHSQFLEGFVERLNAERDLEVVLNTAGTMEIYKPPIEQLPEWHEWLVKVAMSERNDYRRAQEMREAMRATHGEMDFTQYRDIIERM